MVKLAVVVLACAVGSAQCAAKTGLTFAEQIASDMGLAISSDNVCGTDYAAQELAGKYPEVRLSKDEVGISLIAAQNFLKAHGKDDFCLTAKAMLRKALGHDAR